MGVAAQRYSIGIGMGVAEERARHIKGEGWVWQRRSKGVAKD